MPTIRIRYDLPTRTFIASDESSNVVAFQTVPDGEERPHLAAVSSGVRPMQGLLMSLGACSGIDIVSILDKQRQAFTDFSMVVSGERAPEVVPSLWVTAHVDFILSGDIGADKALRAAALSIDKYCSVAETLRRAGCTISYAVYLNEVLLNT